MPDLITDQLSALFDSELPSEEVSLLLKRLEQADELKSTWCRYQLIQDVVRQGELICDYPKLIQSIDLLRQSTEESESLLASPPRDTSHTLRKKTRRKVWGASVAAAVLIVVAAMAISLLPHSDVSSHQPPNSSARNVITETLPLEGLVAFDEAKETTAIDEWHKLTPEMQARLSGYIMNYDNYSSSERMSGINPGFVRMVAYER